MMTGTGPFGPIEMGGMFTVLKIRDGITELRGSGLVRLPAGNRFAEGRFGTGERTREGGWP